MGSSPLPQKPLPRQKRTHTKEEVLQVNFKRRKREEEGGGRGLRGRGRAGGGGGRRAVHGRVRGLNLWTVLWSLPRGGLRWKAEPLSTLSPEDAPVGVESVGPVKHLEGREEAGRRGLKGALGRTQD